MAVTAVPCLDCARIGEHSDWCPAAEQPTTTGLEPLGTTAEDGSAEASEQTTR